MKFTVFIRIQQYVIPQVWNWHFEKQMFYGTILYSNQQRYDGDCDTRTSIYKKTSRNLKHFQKEIE